MMKKSIIQWTRYLIKKLIFVFKLSFSRPDVYLIGTPFHSNIGDIAITIAEIDLFRKNKISYFEINTKQFLMYKKYIKKKIFNKVICFQGGGNIGDVWINEENLKNEIIRDCLPKKVIIFPQSIYYTKTKKGLDAMNEAKTIYKTCDNITIFLRDKTSFEIAKEMFPNANLFFCPDLVLHLTPQPLNNRKRIKNDIEIIIRDDSESNFTENERKMIVNNLRNQYSLTISDMAYRKRNISNFKRKSIVNDKIEEISSHRIVVTDRLHGLLLSIISGVPCVVLPNHSHKIKSVVEFICRYTDSIIFVEDISEIVDKVKELIKKPYNQFLNSGHIREYYTVLINELKAATNE